MKHVSDTIAIMYLGRIVEKGPVEDIFQRPAHHYTRALIQAIPVPDPRHRRAFIELKGETPSPVSPPSGCPFHPRCLKDCRDWRDPRTPALLLEHLPQEIVTKTGGGGAGSSGVRLPPEGIDIEDVERELRSEAH